MPRFAILAHNWPQPHWDLLLEDPQRAVCRTWRLLTPPDQPRVEAGCVAEPIADHRLVYLDYEGPVSGNRGHVRQWDAGTWELLSETPSETVFVLRGRRLHGRCRIRTVSVPADGDAPESVQFRFETAD